MADGDVLRDDKEIFFNNEAIQLLHQPAAHTDGDVVVFFRRSDVVATGDLFTTTGYPVVDRHAAAASKVSSTG